MCVLKGFSSIANGSRCRSYWATRLHGITAAPLTFSVWSVWMVDRVWFCSSWQFNAPASFLRLLTVADCVRVMSEKVNVRWVRVRGRGCVGVCGCARSYEHTQHSVRATTTAPKIILIPCLSNALARNIGFSSTT